MAAAATGSRPIFDPVDTTFDPRSHSAQDTVESPSLTSGNALARFEFEPGKSKDGTKVLMVEWEEDDTTQPLAGDWELSWEGKRTVLPAKDQNASAEVEETPVNRLYFLLGPGVAVPTSVSLRKDTITWRTNPLPAIFPPELGATARQAGKRGVLHTIWAKKRLQVLQNEIEQESKENAEGIGYEMAVAEKEWIEQNFGVFARPVNLSLQTPATASVMAGGGLNSPTSPTTPGGGRLMDKLKGLKLGTTSQDLNSPRKDDSSPPQGFHNPLSPMSSDVAVGSFGSFSALKGAPPVSNMAAKPPQPPASTQPQPRKITAHSPPESFQRQQANGGGGGMGSLNAFASGDLGRSQQAPPPTQDEDEEDLFAISLSPRSPDMSRSPFSFATQDTAKYLQEGGAS